MRKLFLTITLVMTAAWAMAAYYVAGNGTSGNPWCDGKSWVVNGSQMEAQGNGVYSKTFENVPVGSYQFKVTTGSSWLAGSKFSQSCSNITCSTPDNIVPR